MRLLPRGRRPRPSPRRRDRRVQRRAEFPPLEQGTSELLGVLAAIIVLIFIFRTFVAMIIRSPSRSRRLHGVPAPFILAGLTDINTITPILSR
jgi:hypothetical protein